MEIFLLIDYTLSSRGDSNVDYSKLDGENTQHHGTTTGNPKKKKKKKKIEEDRPPPNITFTVDTLKELCCSIDLSISQRQQRIYLQQQKCQPLIKHFDNVRNQRRNHHRLVIPHNNMPRV